MASGEVQSTYDDPMYLSSSDHASMQLTTRQFDGNNYLGWARSARLALSTKSKLGFVTGTCVRPEANSSLLPLWLWCDSMVNCWILNSLTPDIADGVSYLNSAMELWNELRERYGQTNGPLIYQLKSELAGLKQNHASVTSYYNKLKRVWDELKSVEVLPQCTCEALKDCKCDILKKFQDIEFRNQLLQFLMGLDDDDDYEQLRGDILRRDTLPTVSRAYFLVLQLEKQRQLTGSGSNDQKVDYEACVASKSSSRGGGNSSHGSRKESNKVKADRFCDHCKIRGHTIDDCFKLHGYPDGFKVNKGRSTPRLAGQVNSKVTTHHPKTTTHHVVFGSQTIETTVTSDALTITQWVTDMLSLHRGKTVIVGLNVERKPNRKKYINNRAATLQLCIGTKCLIIQLIYLRAVPQSLRDFLLSETMTFVGVELTGDVAEITTEYGLACRNVMELRTAAGFGSVPRVGLKILAMEVVGLEIEKPKNVTLSNWEVSVLSDSQVKYACGDAYASYSIGDKLWLQVNKERSTPRLAGQVNSEVTTHHPKTTTHHVVFGSQTIETTVTSDALTITQWVTDMLSLHRGKTVIVGLDVEWKPNRIKYMSNKAAILQLCIGTKCLIIQLIYLKTVPQSLRDFLLSETMTFVGVEVTGDVAKITREYGLVCRNVMELRTAAGFGSVPRVGLKRLAMEVVGLEIEKPKNVTLSNWEVSVLSDSQVKYACGDAYASYSIGHKLSLQD